MEPDVYTFADSETGLVHAMHITVSLRRIGFRTRLATRGFSMGTIAHSEVATPPQRKTRREIAVELSASFGIPVERFV